MTCESCATKVKSALLRHPDVLSAKIDHVDGKAYLKARSQPDRRKLEKLLAHAGEYGITSIAESKHGKAEESLPADKIATLQTISVWTTYKPLILIFLFLSGTASFTFVSGQSFTWFAWMRYFMAGFFLVFSFFKFLDLKGFARSFAMYDILAAKWKPYGYIYPFLELGLGILYLTALHLPITLMLTVIIMGFSSMGVIRNMLSAGQVQCACLGTVFKLPLGKVTLIEDVLMLVMAGMMLLL